jgi:hypothetical protein
MNPAVAQETHDMKFGFVADGVFDCGIDGRHFIQFFVSNRNIDSGQGLEDNASGTDVEMSDFTIAHLSFRQTDILTAGP